MPELPELEALAERLDDALAGAPLRRAVPLQFSALKTFEPRPESLAGRTLTKVGRRGKYIVFELAGPRVLVHLSQGGRVALETPAKASRPKGGVVRLLFEGRPGVLVKEYGSQRKASWWVLSEGDEGPLAVLGPEPFSEEFERLVMTSGDRRRLHSLLRDQRTVAGIGRGYTDDILHHARLSPYGTLASLDDEQRHALVGVTRAVLTEALRSERKRTGGLPAQLNERFVIHGRAGHPCPRCRSDLRRVSFDGYELVYCPTCQTGGKILADRRLSRLVK